VRLEAGETIQLKRLANRTQGNRAIGGRLVVTDRRLAFSPSSVERRLRAQDWQCLLAEVREVDTAKRTADPLSGGLRRRVRVALTGNREELFVVNDVDEVARQIRAVLPDRDR
jgi:ABC-type taurine transport system ATPase subunit